MNKTGVIIAVVIVAALAIWGFVSFNKKPAITNQEPIKIGSIAALTGVGTTIGEEELKGAQLAVEEANRDGGVNGRRIELVSEDVSIDKLKSAVTVANKLITVDKVVAIVGPQWDEPALAILPTLDKTQTPTVGPDTTDTVETNGQGAYLFSTWYDNRVGIETLLTFAEKRGLKNIAIIRPLNAGFWKFASDRFAAGAKAHGLTIVDDVDIGNPLLTDYRTPIAKVKTKNPDAIFFVTSDPGECIFLKQMKELGVTAPLLATESAGNRASLDECPIDMTNLYFSTPSVDHPGYTTFEQAFVKKYNRKPLFPSAVTAYDGVRVIVAALKETNGKGGPDLQKALSLTKNFPGASLPSITFKENGFVVTPGNAFVVQTVKDGKFIEVE